MGGLNGYVGSIAHGWNICSEEGRGEGWNSLMGGVRTLGFSCKLAGCYVFFPGCLRGRIHYHYV